MRIAVCQAGKDSPVATDLASSNPRELIDEAVERTLAHLKAQGSDIPSTAVRAAIENLIHADFDGATVTVSQDGGSIAIADRGPGIDDPQEATRLGYSTATEEMREIIPGVGGGLALAEQAMARASGVLSISSNLESGTVVTLALGVKAVGPEAKAAPSAPTDSNVDATSTEELSPRGTQVLLLMADGREIGPSEVADHVGCSVTTAYRDLTMLERKGLVAYTSRGRRRISVHGEATATNVLDAVDDEDRG